MSDLSNDYVVTEAEFSAPYVGPDGLARATGGVPMPADAEKPRCVRALDIPIIPRHEWPERIKEMEANKSRLSDLRDTCGPGGGPIPSLDQANRGYCWAHSVVAAMLLVRARAGEPFADLSAYAVACVIKQFRDEGGWNPAALDFVTERGCPTSKTWPQRATSRSHDNQRTWEEAAQYRVTEGWADLAKSVYDRDMTFDQHFSALLLRVPVPADRYRWSHSTVDCDPLEVDPSRDLQDIERWGIRGWNSWGDAWGVRGMFVMRGRLALADLATAPRVISAH